MNAIDAIVNDFEMLDDWDQRYEYLVELGEQLAPMPDAEKTEKNRVKPCMSRVWVKAFCDSDDGRLVRFHGDCDTAIIKGVVGLLVNLFSGRTPEEVLAIDVDKLFDRIRLAEHLSPNRHVGIYAVVEVMRCQVQSFLAFPDEVVEPRRLTCRADPETRV